MDIDINDNAVREALAALERQEPQRNSKYQLICKYSSKIQALLKAGHDMKSIAAAISNAGVEITGPTISSYLCRYRKEAAAAASASGSDTSPEKPQKVQRKKTHPKPQQNQQQAQLLQQPQQQAQGQVVITNNNKLSDKLMSALHQDNKQHNALSEHGDIKLKSDNAW